MPVNPTYPGVYVQEVKSGVHTVTGVSTSVTAFAGKAKRGPINKAVHIFSFKDYEQVFGGLSKESEMSYAVSQFFLNGGNEAWIVRLALNAAFASVNLLDSTGNICITVTAVDQGTEANYIQVIVSGSSIGSDAFDLTFVYTSPDNPADTRTEVYKGLSMRRTDSRFVEDVINDVSLLVTVKAKSANSPQILNTSAGSLTSGVITKGDIDNLPDATHNNSFRIAFDGNPAETVMLDTTNIPDPTKVDLANQLQDMAARIQKVVRAQKPGIPSWSKFTCAPSSDHTKLVLTSGTVGSTSSVRVNDAEQTSIAYKLHLLNTSVGPLTSGAFTKQGKKGDIDNLPDATHNSFRIAFDGNPTEIVTLDTTNIPDPTNVNLATQLQDMAARIQRAVQAKKPTIPSWSNFTCAPSPDNTKLVLTSGTASVTVSDAEYNNITNILHLNMVGIPGTSFPQLAEGGGDNFDINKNPDVFFPSDNSDHTGVYALDKVDLFNLLCLPAVTGSCYAQSGHCLLQIAPGISHHRRGAS